MLLAAIKAIGNHLLVLPGSTQSFVKQTCFAEICRILKFINADNQPDPFVNGYFLGKSSIS